MPRSSFVRPPRRLPRAGTANTWLHGEAEVIDTTHLTPAQAAQRIAEAVKS